MPLPDPGPPAPDALVGRTVGPYRVESRLGAGGMGVVYRATDERLGREVALKFLAPQLHADAGARARLLQEARAVAALDHPHVATVHDVGETPEGALYLAMAYYRGETLAEVVARGPVDPAEAVVLGIQIAEGLAAAHRAGVVHRDVKPANILVVPEGGPGGGPCAVVLDFGIAKTDDVALTRTGQSVGTALYMAPEQVRGEPADARADVWGLGVVLYEMLAGRRPFGGPYPAAASYAVLHEEPPPLPPLPDGLAETVARCLAKDPDARVPSAQALADALARVRDGRAPDAAPTGPQSAPNRSAELGPTPPAAGAPRWARRWLAAPRWRWAAALGAAALAVALATAVWPGSATAEPQRLAVLPFRTVGPDAQALSAGLVETVTGKLGGLAALRGRVRVVPASEVDPGLTPTQAHDRLGATLVVEGTVQTEGGRVRVTLTLVDVADGEPDQVGVRALDDDSGSSFALQDAAVLELAGLLRVEVAGPARRTLAAGGTDDPEANELYLRGRGVLRQQQGAADLARARALFARALALDPSFALAHAALADAQWETYGATSETVWADRAVESAQRALDLDGDLAEVHTALGVIHEGRGEYDRALAALARALDLDPDHAEAVRRLARVYAAQGRADEAEAAFRRAVALEPDSWRARNSFGVFYLRQGRTGPAAEQFRRALAADPTNTTLLYNLGSAAWKTGDLDEAGRAFDRVRRLDTAHASAVTALAAVRFARGDYARAAETAARAVALRPDDPAAHIALAESRWWTPGQRDRARQDYARAADLARAQVRVGPTPDALVPLAVALLGSGRPDSARAVLDDVEAMLAPADATVEQAYALAVASERAGRRDRALAWLESAFRRDYGRVQARRSPWLAGLRSSPSYRSLSPPAP